MRNDERCVAFIRRRGCPIRCRGNLDTDPVLLWSLLQDRNVYDLLRGGIFVKRSELVFPELTFPMKQPSLSATSQDRLVLDDHPDGGQAPSDICAPSP